MNRRGILGMFGAGAVAGPAIAQDVLSQAGINTGLSSGAGSLRARSRYMDNEDAVTSEATEGYDDVNSSSDYSYEKRQVKSRFNALQKAKSQKFDGEQFRNFINNVEKLDSDLASNRSLSLNTKIRLQAERNYKLYLASQIKRQEKNLSYSLRSLKRSLKGESFYAIITSAFGVGAVVPTFEDIQDIINRNEDEDDDD